MILRCFMFKIEVENILNITLLTFFMDSTEKNAWSWWFGAHLFVLLMCSISYTMFRGTNVSVLLLLNILFPSPFAFTHIYFQPFRQEWVSLVDSLILLDLLLIEHTSLYLSYTCYVLSLLLSPIVLTLKKLRIEVKIS